MNVLFVSAEAAPYATTGGLGDVSYALPSALSRENVTIRLFIPEYKSVKKYFKNENIKPKEVMKVPVFLAGKYYEARINESKHPLNKDLVVYTLDYPPYFNRFGIYTDEKGIFEDNLSRYVFFQKAVIEFIRKMSELPKYEVDVLHINDWHTALLALYVKETYAAMCPFDRMAVVYTIHNFLHQGRFWALEYPTLGIDWKYFNSDVLEYFDMINLMKAGVYYADFVNTVSPGYAQEVLNGNKSAGLEGFMQEHKDKFLGILNGADYEKWSPETDEYIKKNYSLESLSDKEICKIDVLSEFGIEYEEDKALLAFVGRLDEQKGISMLFSVLEMLLRRGLNVVFLGTGNISYEQIFQSLKKQYAGRFGVITEFNNKIAHKVYAGADIFLMPSAFEPCGLGQIYAMRYGTIPVVHDTGGLSDTVFDYSENYEKATGFKFRPYFNAAFMNAIERALKVYEEDKNDWKRIIKNAMSLRFLYSDTASAYMDLYEKSKEKSTKALKART